MRIPWVDVKLAFRVLVKYPALTAVGIVSMSVAVAAVAGTFAVTDNLLDPKLPLAAGDRLVALQSWDVSSGAPEPRAMGDFLNWRDELTSVDHIGAFASFERDVSRDGGSSRQARVAEVTSTAFTLGETAPHIGRLLVETDGAPQAGEVAVIGYRVWQELFAGDPEAVGRTLRIGDTPHEVVGVMPEGFRFPLNHSLWVPLRTNSLENGELVGPPIVVFGRLAEGVDLGEAQAELSVLGRRAAQDSPETHATLRPRVVLYAEPWVGTSRLGYAGVRLGLVFLLLVVGTNLGALVLARNLTREGEIAVRRALGAGRGQIVLQLTIEALLLVSLASVVGLLVASWGVGVMSRVMADFAFGIGGLPFWWQDGLTPGTVYRVSALNVLSAILCGTLPAFVVTRRREWGRLQQSASSSWSPRVGLGAKFVIASQFALSVGLLTLAVAEWPDMIANEVAIEGLTPEAYLTAVVRSSESGGSGRSGTERPALSLTTRQSLASRLEVEPGVVGVTLASALPGMLHPQVRTETDGLVDAFDEHRVRYSSVDPTFFDVMGARILVGRGFTEQDLAVAENHPVVIVNESYARNRLGGMSVVGRRLRFVSRTRDVGAWREVVGIAQDFRMNSIDPSRPEGIYVPLDDAQTVLSVAIRTTGDPARLTPRLRAISATLEPGMVAERVRPLDAILQAARAQRRIEFIAVGFGTLAVLMLTMGGLSAVTSFFVSRRIHEIGIRTALGARPVRVALDIYAGVVRRLGWGVAAGIPTGIIVGSVVLEGGSVGVALKVTVALVAVGLLACAPATRRLLRVDPVDAIRGDA